MEHGEQETPIVHESYLFQAQQLTVLGVVGSGAKYEYGAYLAVRNKPGVRAIKVLLYWVPEHLSVDASRPGQDLGSWKTGDTLSGQCADGLPA